MLSIDDALKIWNDCNGLGDTDDCNCPLMNTTDWEELSICSMFCQVRDALNVADALEGQVVPA